MEYVGYKKIHRRGGRNARLTIVEWPGGGLTLDVMGRVTKGVWSGGSLRLSTASAKWIKRILARIYGRGR